MNVRLLCSAERHGKPKLVTKRWEATLNSAVTWMM